jgi:pimeloyl-ACP methyl ester carboxylesterase
VRRRIWSALCVLILVTVSLGTGINLAKAEDNVPRFEKAKCKFTVPKTLKIDCGYLIVREDRSSANSQTIRLAVAIFRAKVKKAVPDAVVYLEGGPGGHSIDNARESFEYAFSGFAQKRDFIMFDQRGVGFSEPSLDCPEETKAAYDGLTKRMSFEDRTALENQAIKACHDRLVSKGINLSMYNSAANAADVNDLRIALGYKELDLYGISYGTRLALTVMRDFPQNIRGVILDSTVPLQADLYGRIPANADRAFKVFFQGCLKNRQCNAAYPNLDKVFYDLVAKLNAKPAAISVRQPITGKKFSLRIDGHHLIEMLFSALYSRSVIVYLPKIIYDASNGSYSLLQLFLGGSLVKHEYVSIGMYYSVQCAEEVAFDSRDVLVGADKSYPSLMNTFDMGNYYTQCQIWDVKPAPPVENQPVKSSIYTLVLAGQYDPITPPGYGWQAAQTLNHSYYFEFPGVGHGVSVGDRCPYQVAIAFFDNPKVKPEIGCISVMTEPRFITR